MVNVEIGERSLEISPSSSSCSVSLARTCSLPASRCLQRVEQAASGAARNAASRGLAARKSSDSLSAVNDDKELGGDGKTTPFLFEEGAGLIIFFLYFPPLLFSPRPSRELRGSSSSGKCDFHFDAHKRFVLSSNACFFVFPGGKKETKEASSCCRVFCYFRALSFVTRSLSAAAALPLLPCAERQQKNNRSSSFFLQRDRITF